MSKNVNLSIPEERLIITERFPKFLKLLFFVEMWERFSYYGARTLLVLFLISHLGFTDTKAYAIYSLFAAISYSGPVVGGFLADKLMGFRNMVVLGAIIIVVGHISMILVSLKSEFIYFGLALIAVGTGMFKGNITNLLGSCYRANDPERNRGFTIFYVSINVGSALASIFCGYIAHFCGYHYGFSLAAIGMIIGLITFIKFQYLLDNHGLAPYPELMHKPIFGLKIFNIVLIGGLLFSLIICRILMSNESCVTNISIFNGVVISGIFAYIISKSSTQERKNLIILFILIVFVMCFFALELHIGSLINLFVARNVNNKILGITIPASVSQAINPLSIIILGSLFGTYIKFEKKYTTSIFAFGLLTMAISFFILYIGCVNADIAGKVGYLYLVIAISFIGLGELCIQPIVLEQTTLLAPKRFKGLIMGMVMLSLSFASLAGSIISKSMSVTSIGGKIDYFESLAIYREGFLKIGISYLGIVAMFLLVFMLVHKAITRASYSEE